MDKSVFNKYIIDKIKSIINENDINVIGRDAKEISKDIWNLDYIYLGEIANDIYKKCEEEILCKLDRWDMYDIFNSMFDDAVQEDILSAGAIGSYNWIDMVIMEKWTMRDVYKDIFEDYLYHNFNVFIEQIIKEEEKRKEEQEKSLSTLKTLVEKELKNYREKMLSNGTLYVYDKTWEIQMYKNINDYIQSLSYKKFNECNKEEILRLCELNDGELIFENLFDKISKSAKTFIYYNVNVKKELDKIFIKDK